MLITNGHSFLRSARKHRGTKKKNVLHLILMDKCESRALYTFLSTSVSDRFISTIQTIFK